LPDHCQTASYAPVSADSAAIGVHASTYADSCKAYNMTCNVTKCL